MTLRELLKDKTLPVRVRATCWNKSHTFEVHYIHGTKAYGHHCEDFEADQFPLDGQNWELAEPKRPRLLAWRHTHLASVFFGGIMLAPEDKTPFDEPANWERAPWLDQPAGDA